MHLPRNVLNETRFFGFLVVATILRVFLCIVLSLKLNIILMTPFFYPSMVHWLQWFTFVLCLFGQISNQCVYWIHMFLSYFHCWTLLYLKVIRMNELNNYCSIVRVVRLPNPKVPCFTLLINFFDNKFNLLLQIIFGFHHGVKIVFYCLFLLIYVVSLLFCIPHGILDKKSSVH